MEAPCTWNGPRELYMNRCRMLYNAARSLGANIDAAGRESDWSRYRLLVVPFLSAMTDELAAKLAGWVEAGGTLVWHPLSGSKNAEASLYPDRLHPALQELFGVRLREFVPTPADTTHRFEWNGTVYETGLFIEVPELAGAEPLASYTTDWFAGSPAVTVRASGQGRAVFVASLPAEPYCRDFLAFMARSVGIEPVLSGVPAQVEAVERSADDGRRIVFLNNYSAEPQTVALPATMADVWSGEAVGPVCRLAGHGVRVLLAGEAAPG
jgi:beta-galactosidase